MAHVTFSLTKQDRQTNQKLHATTTADLSREELNGLLQELRASGVPEVSEFATIYVAPEEYTFTVNGESIPLKPQFFPPAYGYIINKLIRELK